MKKKAWISIAVLLCVSASGNAGAFAQVFSGDYIIRGVTVRAADPIASTTVAVINRSHGDTALCTGSLIAEDLVVTAGHCVSGSAGSELFIEFDRNLPKSHGDHLVRVSNYARPKSFGHMTGEEDMNDIALLRFAGGIPSHYRLAKLLQDSSLLKDGAVVTLAGYGVSDGTQHEEAGDAGAGVLRKVNVKIAHASYGRTEVEMDQTHGHGACHGDSGGPAFIKLGSDYLLFGVTSRGMSGGADDCSSTSIYTNILAHTQFIRQATAELRKR